MLRGINEWIAYNNTGRISVPDAFFFNKSGYRVKDNFRGTTCGYVINNADRINTAPSENKEHVNDWLKDFDFPFTQDKAPITNEQYDSYVIITWAKFIEAVTSNTTSVSWYKSLRNNKDLKIKIILLNLDLQDNWTLTAEQEEALGLREAKKE